MTSIAKKCLVTGCEKKHDSHGYCGAHQRKWKKYGDPLFSIYEAHKLSTSPEYRVWSGMKRRCYNKNEKSFVDYGGRGIAICDRWRNSFKNFYMDMGRRPSGNYSIDRIDVNGNYEPSNCRWATKVEQMNNMTTNRPITINGETKNIMTWIRLLDMPSSTYGNRLKRGWSVEKALFEPRMTQYGNKKT